MASSFLKHVCHASGYNEQAIAVVTAPPFFTDWEGVVTPRPSTDWICFDFLFADNTDLVTHSAYRSTGCRLDTLPQTFELME